ncbi:MAG: hypothetical protein WBO42_11135 [Candidatus Nanopelagicales bacterium]
MAVDDDVEDADDDPVELLGVVAEPEPSELPVFAAPSLADVAAGVFEEPASELLDLALLAAARLSFL